ncbi:MAG: hypothetical protein WC012_13405 [Thiohalomonadaceae bacterium]
MLLTLAFAITIRSVTSPIGNPQNLLIALHGGMEAPFVSFFRHLLLPTLLNLVLEFFILRGRSAARRGAHWIFRVCAGGCGGDCGQSGGVLAVPACVTKQTVPRRCSATMRAWLKKGTPQGNADQLGKNLLD